MKTRERAGIILGDDTPSKVLEEVYKNLPSGVFNFSWNSEDNEMMPLLAEYLETKYNLYECVIIS